MALKLYFDLMSQPSRSVYMFLKAAKIPFEAKPIALRKGEHFTDEYKKINYFSLVPAIDDNGYVLTESVAIMKYLSVKHGLADHWYPADLRSQARIDEYVNWHHLNLRATSAMLFRELLVEPQMKGGSVNWDRVNKFKQQLNTKLDGFEAVFLKKPFIGGDKISIADILAVCELSQLHAVHEEAIFTKHPVVHDWMNRVKENLEPHFSEAHKIIARTREIFPTLSRL